MATNYNFTFKLYQFETFKIELTPIFDSLKVIVNVQQGMVNKDSDGSLKFYGSDYSYLFGLLPLQNYYIRVYRDGIDYHNFKIDTSKIKLDLDKKTLEIYFVNETQIQDDLLKKSVNALEIIPVEYRNRGLYHKIWNRGQGNVNLEVPSWISGMVKCETIAYNGELYQSLSLGDFEKEYPLVTGSWTDYVVRNYTVIQWNNKTNQIGTFTLLATNEDVLYQSNNGIKFRYIAKLGTANYKYRLQNGSWNTIIIDYTKATFDWLLDITPPARGNAYWAYISDTDTLYSGSSNGLGINWFEVSYDYLIYGGDISVLNSYGVLQYAITNDGKRYKRIQQNPNANSDQSDWETAEELVPYFKWTYSRGLTLDVNVYLSQRMFPLLSLLNYLTQNLNIAFDFYKDFEFVTNLYSLFVAAKSDIKRPTANLRATIALVTFNDIKDWLFSLFDLRLGFYYNLGIKTYFFYYSKNLPTILGITDLRTVYPYDVTAGNNVFENNTDEIFYNRQTKTEDNEYSFLLNTYGNGLDSKQLSVNIDIFELQKTVNDKKFADDGFALAFTTADDSEELLYPFPLGTTLNENKFYPSQVFKVPNTLTPNTFDFFKCFKTELTVTLEQLTGIPNQYVLQLESYKFNLSGEFDELKLKSLI